MKKTNYIYSLLMLAGLAYLSSCEKVDLHKGADPLGKGLLNFSIQIPGQATEYSANAGPYDEGDTIVVDVPSTEDDPLDVTKLKPLASLENNSRMEPALTGLMDFKKPVPITVVTGDGARKHYFVKVVPKLPRTLFKKNWFMTNEVLGIKKTNLTGMAVVGDNLLIADFASAEVGIKVYDKKTGAFKKNIANPFSAEPGNQVVADDGGHFVAGTINYYKNGFRLYLYDDINSQPQQLIYYADAQGCPEDLGRKVSVIGDLKHGKAFVYATAWNLNKYYYWEYNDGVPVSAAPTIVTYSAASKPWNFASIERKSLADNSDHYIAHWRADEGSTFSLFNSQMSILSMDKKNHEHKILDFEIFQFKGRTLMAAITQGEVAWDAEYIQVYDITNPNDMKLVKESPGYSNFNLFQSEAYGGVNYNKFGDIAVDIQGHNVFIYASMASYDLDGYGGVLSYKMQYNP